MGTLATGLASTGAISAEQAAMETIRSKMAELAKAMIANLRLAENHNSDAIPELAIQTPEAVNAFNDALKRLEQAASSETCTRIAEELEIPPAYANFLEQADAQLPSQEIGIVAWNLRQLSAELAGLEALGIEPGDLAVVVRAWEWKWRP